MTPQRWGFWAFWALLTTALVKLARWGQSIDDF